MEQDINNSQSLHVYLTKISQLIQDGFSQLDWVKVEISRIMKSQNEHYYLELVENDSNGKTIAKVDSVIWRSNAKKIVNNFSKITGDKLKKDMTVLLLVRSTYHPLYGLKLVVEDIDPNYTLGMMIQKIAKIRKALIQEKIYKKNTEKKLPFDFNRIAVISPKDGAGLGDFKKEANILQKHQICEFKYYCALFQGQTAAKEIMKQIDTVEDDHKDLNFDALIIIRGGGAVTDLSWLNDYQLAKKICLFEVPVFVGIGHRRDLTILDEIAKIRFDTPSKVSAYLFSTIIENVNSVKFQYTEIMQNATFRISKMRKEIDLLEKQNIILIQRSYNYFHEMVREKMILLFNVIRSGVIKEENELISHTTVIFCMTKKYISQYYSQVKNIYNQSIIVSGKQKTQILMDKLKVLLNKNIVIISKASQAKKNEIQLLYSVILGYNPTYILNRGYAYIEDINGKVITNIQKVIDKMQLKIYFKDGVVTAQVIKKEKGKEKRG